MSKLILQGNWMRWSPKTIFLKQMNYHQTVILYKKQLIEENLYTYIEHSVPNTDVIQNLERDNIEIEKIKREEYKKGFEVAYEKYKKNEIIFKNKFDKLILSFENSLFMHEQLLFSHVLQTVLIVSSYVIGKNINSDTTLLLEYIKKIVRQDNVLLKKPQLIIHPNNKILIEKILLDFLNTRNWKLVYDTKIDLNGCQVKSESGDLDATMNARWKSVCQLVKEKEH